MFGTDVEDRFVFVVAKVEVILNIFVEVLDQHWHVILLQGVEEGQVSVVVNSVGSWSDLVHDWVLFVDAYDMLNGLALVVLGASGLEELIVTAEPIEDLFVSIPGALKEWVLSVLVSDLETLEFEVLEDVEHLHVLHACGNKDSVLSIVVPGETMLWLELKYLPHQVIVLVLDCNMHWCVSIVGVLAEEIQVLKVIEHVLNDLFTVVLHGKEEWSLTLMVPLLQSIHDFLCHFACHLVQLDYTGAKSGQVTLYGSSMNLLVLSLVNEVWEVLLSLLEISNELPLVVGLTP